MLTPFITDSQCDAQKVMDYPLVTRSAIST
jgi:hypothetical protein